MAKKARTSRPRRAAAPADGFAAPPQEMEIEEEEGSEPEQDEPPKDLRTPSARGFRPADESLRDPVSVFVALKTLYLALFA